MLDWHHALIAHSPLTPRTYGSCRGRSDPSSSQPSVAAELDKIRSNVASVGDTLQYLADNFEGFDDDLEQAYEDAAAVSRPCLAGLLHSRKAVSRVSIATRTVTADHFFCGSGVSQELQSLYFSCQFCSAQANSAVSSLLSCRETSQAPSKIWDQPSCWHMERLWMALQSSFLGTQSGVGNATASTAACGLLLTRRAARQPCSRCEPASVRWAPGPSTGHAQSAPCLCAMHGPGILSSVHAKLLPERHCLDLEPDIS